MTPAPSSPPRVIPVLDLRGGLVVRGVAGDRDNYQPIESTLAAGSNPLEIAEAVRDRYRLTDLYVADLDGIQHGRPDWSVLSLLVTAGFRLAVDVGVRGAEDARRLLDAGVSRVIAGLETSAGSARLEELLDVCGPERLVFSLDLREGRPLSMPGSGWHGKSCEAILRTAATLGIESLLVLDLATVGRESGLSTLALVQIGRRLFPALEIWTGGGIRNQSDLIAAGQAGADAVLIASALHAGRWTAASSADDRVPPPGSPLSATAAPSSFTIYELTPPGQGAVSTLAIEGDLQRLDDGEPLFRAANGRPLATQPLQRVCFGRWGTESPEDVVVCRTEERTVELHCHGGRAAVGRIVADVVARGGQRLSAEAQRSVSRPQLEATCETALLRATTERTAMLLAEQGLGVLRAALERLHVDLTDAAAGDDEALGRGRERLSQLLKWSRFALRLTQPWSVVICGRPNVGKSSLVNAMAGFTRSIVSPMPGTTRDFVTASIVLEGWPIELTDTAGLRTTDDAIEADGVVRALNRLRSADLKLLLVDVSQPLTAEDHQLLADHPDALVVASKSDLPARWESGESAVWPISPNTGRGLPELLREIVRRLIPVVPDAGVALPVSGELVRCLRRLRTWLAASDPVTAAERLSDWLN